MMQQVNLLFLHPVVAPPQPVGYQLPPPAAVVLLLLLLLQLAPADPPPPPLGLAVPLAQAAGPQLAGGPPSVAQQPHQHQRPQAAQTAAPDFAREVCAAATKRAPASAAGPQRPAPKERHDAIG
jgi:hypothetical protein